MGRLTGTNNDYCFFTCYENEDSKIREDCNLYNVCYERQMYEKLKHYEELLSSDDFGTVFICAIRYCIGRQTYMPSMIQRQIRPLLSQLDGGTLIVMRNDIRTAGNWGDERIDKPGWMKFLADIEAELERRKDAL